MTRWRLLETGARPGGWNMACDSALLAAVDAGISPTTVRLYAWSTPTVSLGHHQAGPAPEEAARLRARGLDWVRRPTGGRAVYHGSRNAELTYSVIASLGDPALPGGLAGSYRRIHEAIAVGIGSLGARVDLAPARAGGGKAHAAGTTPTSRRACFAASVPGEIAVGGRKLVGSAQRRARRALLQHGSIPLSGNQSPLAEIWPGSLEPERITTVSAAAGRKVDFDELARALVAALAESFGVELEAGALGPDEETGIDVLLAEPAFA